MLEWLFSTRGILAGVGVAVATAVVGVFVGLQVNLIAAMPSLHAAFPTVCAAVACHLFGWRAWPYVVYTVFTYISPVYLGEHYAVDVLVGVVLGLACYLVAIHTSWFRTVAPLPPAEAGLVQYIGARKLIIALAVFSTAVVLGQINRGSRYQELLPGHEFIARELQGKSELAPFFQGALALREGQQEKARQLLVEGLARPAASRENFSGYILLLTAATETGSLQTLVSVLEAIPEIQSTPLSRHVLEEARRRLTK